MASVSGLDFNQRIRCRDRVVQAAELARANKAQVHYSQEPNRWDGINNRRNAKTGGFPRHADCSSFATWCLWNGLHLMYGLGDLVNGADWTAGFTGTMLDHGKRVRDEGNILRGDCVFYRPGGVNHVAIVVATKHQGHAVPLVVSHGSEAGPLRLKYDYETPTQVRRYI
jgi:hypothetical protein